MTFTGLLFSDLLLGLEFRRLLDRRRPLGGALELLRLSRRLLLGDS